MVSQKLLRKLGWKSPITFIIDVREPFPRGDQIKRIGKTGNEKCCICCRVQPWYQFDPNMPHYCWHCSGWLNNMYRRSPNDDDGEIPF